MQFIANGPDIPETLLQAHEEGHVIFFCGAGISYPADLPGFSGLVKKLFNELGVIPNAVQQAAIDGGQFDTAIGLLEGGIVGSRETVRRKLADILTPNLGAPNATATHEALLTLAQTRSGVTRIITTNFDRLFETVIARDDLKISDFRAPLLPVPKNRWDGLVYLHGLLTASPTRSDLDRLVLSSGDFGLAYLTERWAARFVSELFRNYTVCFVGYSINDPVLRYMMDALAADRLLGESPPEMFAFGNFSKGKESERANEWRAKNVTPILYRERNHHTYLHKTLRAWAATYADGTLGKERIVVDHAMARPSASTQQDNFVGRMLWALSHDSGQPAKKFAEFNPVPPLEWLTALAETRYRQVDLVRFGVAPQSKPDEKLNFSLILRPTPYTHASWMGLVSNGSMDGQWDDVMFQLSRWLLRHLDKPELILWFARNGGQIHERLGWMIDRELQERPKPGIETMLRPVWHLLLTRQLKSPRRHLDLYRWKTRMQREGITTSLRLELREMLSPKIALKEPFLWPEEKERTSNTERLKNLIDWELRLTVDHVHSSLGDLTENNHWKSALPDLLNDFQQLLRDALDLMRELGGVTQQDDNSYLHLPSVSPHWQNRRHRDWVVLIELTRDAWQSLRITDSARATQIARAWFSIPYSTFKRLSLFAAAQDHSIKPIEWVDWLLKDNAHWLWSTETRREKFRLLVVRGGDLVPAAKSRLEKAILLGPPRALFRTDLYVNDWNDLVDRAVWRHLAKLRSSGLKLGRLAAKRFAELSALYPVLGLAEDQRDEFPFWMSGTGDPGFEYLPETKTAGLKRPAIKERWRDALQKWTSGNQTLRSWQLAAPLVEMQTDEFLKENSHGITRWLQAVSKILVRYEEKFLVVCQRLLEMPHQSGVINEEPVSEAINHPVGHITEALLNIWFNQSPDDNSRLPPELEPTFRKLCDTTVAQFRHGRVILASRLIALFRLDQPWTEMRMLPLLDWKINEAEARAAWSGFLWSPRIYRPLLISFKRQMLETAEHYEKLGDHGSQFAAFITYAALELDEGLTVQDYRRAFSKLPPKALREAAQALVHALEGSADQKEDYWLKRVHPFWQKIWPKSQQLASAEIAENLARLCIVAANQFPSVLSTVSPWLKPVEHPHYLLTLLQKSNLSKQYPDAVLQFLDAVISGESWMSKELGECLESIATASPSLKQDVRFKRLTEYFLKRKG